MLRSDSQAALSIVAGLESPLPSVRLFLNIKDLEIAQAIKFIIPRRTVSHAFEWVRGHSGLVMNECADLAANDARLSAALLFRGKFITLVTQFSLRAQGTPITG